MSVKEFTIRGVLNMVRRRDLMETAMESALQPGHFIAWNQGSAFVAVLVAVGTSLTARPPRRSPQAELPHGALTKGRM